MEEEAKLVPKNGSDCEGNGASSAAANGKYDLCGRTATSVVKLTVDEISPASHIKQDGGITYRSESIPIGFGDCFLAIVVLALLIVLSGGALVLGLSNGSIRRQFRHYLGIRRPNIGTSRSFASNKLRLIVLVAFNFLIRQSTEHMSFFEWNMDAIILIQLFIPVIQLLYLLFQYFSPGKGLNRDDEITQTEDVSDEAVNTEVVIQVHDSAAGSISVTTYFSPWERRARIGAGGYGIVYEARNRQTGDLCAVKELKNIENGESIRKEIKNSPSTGTSKHCKVFCP